MLLFTPPAMDGYRDQTEKYGQVSWVFHTVIVSFQTFLGRYRKYNLESNIWIKSLPRFDPAEIDWVS